MTTINIKAMSRTLFPTKESAVNELCTYINKRGLDRLLRVLSEDECPTTDIGDAMVMQSVIALCDVYSMTKDEFTEVCESCVTAGATKTAPKTPKTQRSVTPCLIFTAVLAVSLPLVAAKVAFL